eukprot:scaffold242476_cov23-Prasinocladus_malaysianus.AAC.3
MIGETGGLANCSTVYSNVSPAFANNHQEAAVTIISSCDSFMMPFCCCCPIRARDSVIERQLGCFWCLYFGSLGVSALGLAIGLAIGCRQ